MKRPLKRILGNWGIVTGALLTAGIGYVLYSPRFEFGERLVHASYDLPFSKRGFWSPQDVLMIYMDDESHERLEQRLDAPWDRRLHTQMLNRLTAAGTKAVVFDIVFSDPSRDPAVDEDFGRAILANGSVVLAADNVPAGYGVDLANIKRVTLPTEVLRDSAAQIGLAEVRPSSDLVVRQHFHGASEDILPGMSWAAAVLAGAEITKNDANRLVPRWLNYYGPAGMLPSVSYFRALDTNLTGDDMFRDKVVFIGARLFTKFAGERKDEFASPYSESMQGSLFFPGAEIQATQFLNLVRGDWLGRWTPRTELTLIIIYGAMLGAILVMLRPKVSVPVAGGSVVLVVLVSFYGFVRQQGWFPWMIPLVQTGVGLLWAVSFNSLRLYVQNRLLEQSLALHLSPSRVKQLIQRPDLLRPGAEKQELSILFSDIADFTKMSEGMDSDDLAHMMNTYFEAAISAVHSTDGTVVKLIGDAIFAVWNAPLPQADHRVMACKAAKLLRDQPVSFMAGGRERVLFTRIGLHTGVANVGNFGSATRFDYTALGENINLASRMEGLNKHLGTQVLMTGDTHQAVGEHLLTRHLGGFQLKGFEKPVQVYELVGSLEDAGATREWRELFAQALKLYQDRDFATAQIVFNQVLHVRPEDGPSKFYLEKLSQIDVTEMAGEWSGFTRMQEK